MLIIIQSSCQGNLSCRGRRGPVMKQVGSFGGWVSLSVSWCRLGGCPCSDVFLYSTGRRGIHAFKGLARDGEMVARPAMASSFAADTKGTMQAERPSRVAMGTPPDWKGFLLGCEGQKEAP